MIRFMLLSILSLCNFAYAQDVIYLKDAFRDKFLIGTALNSQQINEKDAKQTHVIVKSFSSIVAENSMKSMYLQPKEGEFDFEEADKFVEFGLKNQMFIIAHTLVWHSQAPDWFFVDANGVDVSREVLINRMKNHIQTIVSRYKRQNQRL